MSAGVATANNGSGFRGTHGRVSVGGVYERASPANNRSFGLGPGGVSIITSRGCRRQ